MNLIQLIPPFLMSGRDSNNNQSIESLQQLESTMMIERAAAVINRTRF